MEAYFLLSVLVRQKGRQSSLGPLLEGHPSHCEGPTLVT